MIICGLKVFGIIWLIMKKGLGKGLYVNLIGLGVLFCVMEFVLKLCLVCCEFYWFCDNFCLGLKKVLLGIVFIVLIWIFFFLYRSLGWL